MPPNYMDFLSVTMYFVCVPKQSALTRRTRWQRYHKEGYPGYERVWTLNLMVSRGLNVFSPPPQQVWWPLEVHKVICQPLIGGFYAKSWIHSRPRAFPVLTWSLIIEVRLVLPEVYELYEGYPGFETVWTLNLMVSFGVDILSVPPQQVSWQLELHKVMW